MDVLNFAEKTTLPLASDWLDKQYQIGVHLERCIAGMVAADSRFRGGYTIVCGCTQSGSAISDGLIATPEGKVYKFKQSAAATYLTLKKTVTDVTAWGEVFHPYEEWWFELSGSTTGAQAYVAWSAVKRYSAPLGEATFIVDSDAALAAWASNAPGNDYRHVLIGAGTWHSGAAVDLTAAGTSVVTGQAGGMLSFTSALGLHYQALPTLDGYRMVGVTVTVTSSDTSVVPACFKYCRNLKNCTGAITAPNNACAFASCERLASCTGSSSISGTGAASAFSDSRSLYGCAGNAQTSPGATGVVHTFMQCHNVYDCNATATSRSGGTSIGFMSCSLLTGCTGESMSYEMPGAGVAAGFSSCQRLVCCAGVGSATGANNAHGCGFYGCRVMTMCRPLSASKHATYVTCYMHTSGSNGAVADTADGGWNVS